MSVSSGNENNIENATLKNMLDLATGPGNAVIGSGAVSADLTWNFNSGTASIFDYLGKDDSLVLEYTIVLTDDSLDVTNNTKLTYLGCLKNQLNILNVSQNIYLMYLGCAGNNLSEIDVSKNTLLSSYFNCTNKYKTLNTCIRSLLSQIKCSVSIHFSKFF